MAHARLVMICLTLALSLAPRPAPAQTLAPGKPAGIQAAQRLTQRNLFIAGSLVAVGLAFALPSSSASSTATSATTSTATTS